MNLYVDKYEYPYLNAYFYNSINRVEENLTYFSEERHIYIIYPKNGEV